MPELDTDMGRTLGYRVNGSGIEGTDGWLGDGIIRWNRIYIVPVPSRSAGFDINLMNAAY